MPELGHDPGEDGHWAGDGHDHGSQMTGSLVRRDRSTRVRCDRKGFYGCDQFYVSSSSHTPFPVGRLFVRTMRRLTFELRRLLRRR